MTVSSTPANLPDYPQLVKFLFQPFLTTTEVLGVDCEYTLDRQRVLIRVAVAQSDQGSAFGRGGRNIQAVRTVLQAAAATVGQSLHLDVYGSSASQRERDPEREASADRPSRAPRATPSRRGTNNNDDRPTRGDDTSSNLPPPRPRR